jgi:E-phenylitaconyl-CoA hydratase
VTINRPERLNAIDPDTSKGLLDAFTEFKNDDRLRVAIITGAGEKAFCVGDDLKVLKEATAEGTHGEHEAPFGGITSGFECWKPIIAAINGYCVGGGLEIALSCDIRIAADHATFGLTEPRWSLIPGAGGTQRLPRMVPRAFAMELLLTGGRFDAEKALRWGLVSQVVPLSELMATAESIAGKVAECGPLAIETIKRAVLQGLEMPLVEGLAFEARLSNAIIESEDAREGLAAFAEKRTPGYQRR